MALGRLHRWPKHRVRQKQPDASEPIQVENRQKPPQTASSQQSGGVSYEPKHYRVELRESLTVSSDM